MKLLHKKLKLSACLCLLIGLAATPIKGQEFNLDRFQQTLGSISSQGSRILVLPFNYQNVSETLARSYLTELALVIEELSPLTVIAPDQAQEFFAEFSPELADCLELACGIRSAKILSADYLLIGNLALNANQQFVISTNLIDVRQNSSILQSEHQATVDQLEQKFIELAIEYQENLPLVGQVLDFDNNKVIINLGSEHRLKVGDRLAVLATEDKTPNRQELNLKNHSAAVIEIEQLNEQSSLAIILFSKDTIAIGDGVKTFLNRAKQIELTENTRRNIDQSYLIAKQPAEPERPPSFESSIVSKTVIDYDKIDWINRVRKTESERNLYRWITIGVGGYLGILYFADSDNIALYTLGLAAGGYSSYRFLSARKALDDLVDEGKFKNYLDQNWPQSSLSKEPIAGLAFAIRF